MDKSEIWPTIATERRALAEDLSTLDEAQWDSPSLCEDWTIRDVVAHLTATARVTPLTFFPGLVRSGFSLTRMQERGLATERGDSPAETLERFRSIVDSTNHPPGPADAWLGEALVHAEDIRRPLGIQHDYPAPALIRVAESYAGSNLVMGSKRRIAGLTLRATDADWTHGDGPEVTGPMRSLLMALSGRKAAIEDLSGEGVDTLAAR